MLQLKNMDNGKELNFLVINFDLSTERLKQCYTKSRRSAYREIQHFLENNGFEHRQHSGYVSRSPMDFQDIPRLMKSLRSDLPWVKYCVNKFDFSEIREKEDLDATKYLLDLPEEYAREKNSPRLDLEGVSGSLTEQLQKSASVAKEHNAEATAKTKNTLERI